VVKSTRPRGLIYYQNKCAELYTSIGLPPDGFDCGSTPATPSNTATALSRTRKLRLTSIKATTGVSILMRCSTLRVQKQVVAASAICNAAPLFLFHSVHRRCSFVNFADLCETPV